MGRDDGGAWAFSLVLRCCVLLAQERPRIRVCIMTIAHAGHTRPDHALPRRALEKEGQFVEVRTWTKQEPPALPREASWRIGRGCEYGHGRGRIHSRAGREDDGMRHTDTASSTPAPALRRVCSMPWNVLLINALSHALSYTTIHRAGPDSLLGSRRQSESEARNKIKQCSNVRGGRGGRRSWCCC